MADYVRASMKQFGTWTALLVVYVGLFLGGALLLGEWTQTDATFLLYWRPYVYLITYVPFVGTSIYAATVVHRVYVHGKSFPDNLFFSSGRLPDDAASDLEQARTENFNASGRIVDHVRVWAYLVSGIALVAWTFDDAVHAFTQLAASL